jgi:2-haloacid dehalogenase
MMIAAHGWDVVGAMRAGLKGAFVARPGKAPFPIGPQPTIIGSTLLEIADQLVAAR